MQILNLRKNVRKKNQIKSNKPNHAKFTEKDVSTRNKKLIVLYYPMIEIRKKINEVIERNHVE